jgi:hypothetical protein
METTNYIPHSLIKDIYPRLDINNNPYLRIRLNDNSEYDCRTHITTDANGISGKFILLK